MVGNNSYIEKAKICVNLQTLEGSLTGYIFAFPGTRLSDFMNDSHRFIPFENELVSGKVSLVNKDHIVQ